MGPSKTFGGSEEGCHSSESGWTMYIGSPIHRPDDNYDDDDEEHSEADDDNDEDAYAADNGGGHADETDANHEADSDDSLASDASSGPSHQGVLVQFYGNMEEGGRHGSTSYFKHVEDEEGADCYSDEKAKRSAEKPKLGTKKKEDKEDKQQMTFKAKGATAPLNGFELKFK